MPKYYIVKKRFDKCTENVYFSDLSRAVDFFYGSFCEWEPDPVLISTNKIPKELPDYGEVLLSDKDCYYVYYTY